MKGVLEGLLFVCGDEGISKDRIIDILEIDDDDFSKIIDEYKKDLENMDRGLYLEEFNNNYKLVTKKEHAKYYKKLVNLESSDALSPAALETLAIIAYNQPVTRVMIDEIRGVNSAYLIRKLILKNLIKEVGKSDLPGKPNLYSVTDGFLDYFGLKSLDELPKIEVKEDDEIKELFTSKYKEDI